MTNIEYLEGEGRGIIARIADEDIVGFDFPECKSSEITTYCNPSNSRCYICCAGAFGTGWYVLIDSDTGESVECTSSKIIVVNTAFGQRVRVQSCTVVGID